MVADSTDQVDIEFPAEQETTSMLARLSLTNKDLLTYLLVSVRVPT